MKRCFFTVASLLLLQINVYAQDKEQLVSIRFTNTPLEVILHELNERYHIRFAFAASNSVLAQRITITAEQQPLGEFLNLLLEQAGLEYELVGNHVVLRKKEEEQEKNKVIADHPAGPYDHETNRDNASLTLPEASRNRTTDSLPRLNRIVPEELVSRNFLLTLVPKRVREEAPAAENQHLSAIMITPVVSLDFLQLSVKSNYENNQRLQAGFNYSLGAEGSWRLSEGFSLTMGALVRRKEFILRYMVEIEQEPIGMPEKTTISLSYLEVPVGGSFILLRHNKLSLYGRPEIFGSMLLRHEEITWLDDGRQFNTTAMQDGLLADFLWGGRAVAGLSYALNDRLSVSLSPAYQYTVNKLKDGPQQIRLQTWHIRAGLWICL